jgi:hypothetical protein
MRGTIERLRFASVAGIVVSIVLVIVALLAVPLQAHVGSPDEAAAVPALGNAESAQGAPVAQVPVTPEDYVVLVSGLYAIDGDADRARSRLEVLGLEDPATAVADLAERFLAEGRGDLLTVDLATLARALGVERPGLLPYVATATPIPPTPASAGPSLLPTVEWDPRLSFKLEPPVKVEPAEVASGQTYWRLIRAWWQTPEEGHEAFHIFANVLNKDGVPIPQPLLIENGGKTVVPAEAKPDSDYLINYPMNGTLGSYTCSVAGDIPSDRVVGLGLGFAKGGKDHTSFLLTFQETVAP